MIPFYLKDDIHILLVFGQETLTIVSLEGGQHPKVTKTVKTPYTGCEAEQLDYALCGNLMVLVHRNHPPHQIELTDKEFTFSKIQCSPSLLLLSTAGQ